MCCYTCYFIVSTRTTCACIISPAISYLLLILHLYKVTFCVCVVIACQHRHNMHNSSITMCCSKSKHCSLVHILINGINHNSINILAVVHTSYAVALLLALVSMATWSHSQYHLLKLHEFLLVQLEYSNASPVQQKSYLRMPGGRVPWQCSMVAHPSHSDIHAPVSILEYDRILVNNVVTVRLSISIDCEHFAQWSYRLLVCARVLYVCGAV